jgi:hypothetical protein
VLATLNPFGLVSGLRPNAFCRAVDLPRILADLGVPTLTPTLLATLVAAITHLRQQRGSQEMSEEQAKYAPTSAAETYVYANDLVAALWRLHSKMSTDGYS